MFRYDGPLMKFLGRMADFFILNVLAVICSIPVFTFGAVKTSLLYGIDKIMKDEEGSVVAAFFSQFKMEFKRTTAIWLMYLFIGGVTLGDIYIMYHSNLGTFRTVITTFFLALFALETCVCYCCLGWSSKFNDNIRATLKNGFFIALLNLPRAFIMGVFEVLPWVLLLFITESIGVVIPFYCFIGISLTTVLEVILFRRIFKPFIEKEFGSLEEDETDSHESME